jgi:hypothetical protein
MPADNRRRMTPEELAASRGAAKVKRRLRMLWRGDSTTVEIGEELGITLIEVQRLALEMRLGERTMKAYMPSQQEIRLACARFRASWTSAELESRIASPRRGRLD